MDIPEALSRCLVMNTVAAARTQLRRYDTRLKPYGVTVQQFSLLAAIRFNQGEPVASLAQKVALDGTSLTRNLDLLERKGLIRRVAANGNLRLCQLTEAGDPLLDRLLEEWKEAQSEMLSGLAGEETAAYLRVARHLTNG